MLKIRYRLIICLCSAVFLLGWGQVNAKENAESSIAGFLEKHWQFPIPAQGIAPAHFSVIEKSLQPEDCGACHVEQFKGWSNALHSKAVGPGLLGQLQDYKPHARGQHQSCIKCHAPLKEQADELEAYLSTLEAPPQAIGQDKLMAKGVICAACHVREYQWYGPPSKNARAPKSMQNLPHNGWTPEAAFEKSEFCSACHQFKPGQYQINGKLLENTYNEWRESEYFKKGIQCQNCHMPDRKHLWRGIHDKAMTQSALTVKVADLVLNASQLTTRISLANTGAGHHFPTYVTPKVTLYAQQFDGKGHPIENSLREHVIGRQLSVNLKQEHFDTRIPAGDTVFVDYEALMHADAETFRISIKIEPDEFYTRFYKAMINGGYSKKGTGTLKKALEDSLASHFIMYNNVWSLAHLKKK